MPQMDKGGKFVFGVSRIREDLSIKLPAQAIAEYDICAEERVYVFSGSKKTGGFCVTRKGLLGPSKLGHILRDCASLSDYTIAQGEFLRYKGRHYCWLPISVDGVIAITAGMARLLDIGVGAELLSIRSSDIAFTMGAKGPLLEKAGSYSGKLDVF